MQLNASRIKVLQAQDDLVNSMKDDASKELLSVSGDQKSYKPLLKNLIVQVGPCASCSSTISTLYIIFAIHSYRKVNSYLDVKLGIDYT